MTKLQGVLLTLALLSASVACADGDYVSPTDDRVRLSLGLMRVSASTSVRADTSAGTAGSDINAEDELGLDPTKYEPKFQAMVRVGERNRLRFDYFELDRSGNATLTQPLIFHDAILLAGDPVQSNLSLRTFGITYGYSFWHSERFELAGTLGINSTDLSASARVQTQTRHIYEEEDQAGPFPTVGLDATWVASHRFYFDARAQYFNVYVDHLNGSLGFYEFDALYRLRPNVSFALGYNLVRAHLASTETSQSGEFNFDAKGPQLFVRVAF
jgi:hypothetical protein